MDEAVAKYEMMNRRNLLASLFASTFARRASAVDAGWQARLIQGGFDRTSYLAGLHIMLMPGWKTYWRVPGEAGIPPQIKAEGDNIESLVIEAPVPLRITDGSGEAIGYHDEVLFLLHLKPKAAERPATANISAFFGVCEQVCKPAKFDATLNFLPGITTEPPLLVDWRSKFPVLQNFMANATQNGSELVIGLHQAVDDIFIEGPEELYFRQPTLSQAKAVIKIDGLSDGQSLKGFSLRCTAAMQGKGLEQTITVS